MSGHDRERCEKCPGREDCEALRNELAQNGQVMDVEILMVGFRKLTPEEEEEIKRALFASRN